MGRRFIVAAAAALSVGALAGCVSFKSDPTGAQVEPLGPVKVHIDICATGSSGCPNDGNAASTPGDAREQVLVAFRVPDGTSAPDSFPATYDGGSTTFHSLPSYAGEIQTNFTALPGTHWVGYGTEPVTYNSTSGPQDLQADVTFGLPPGTPAHPYPGPFTYRPVIGFRSLGPSDTGQEPVTDANCFSGSPPFGINACVDAPSPAEITAVGPTVDTRDLGIEGGAVSVAPGHTAQIPFVAHFAGPALPAGQAFALSASPSTLAGGAVSVPPTFAPAAPDSPLVATVAVPPTAAAGSYPLTLTATIAGHTRTATAALTVTPPDFRGVQFPSGVARVGSHGVAQIAVNCPSEAIGRCSGTLSLSRNRGSQSFSLTPGTITHVPVRLSARTRRVIARHGTALTGATATSTDATGVSTKVTATLALHGKRTRRGH